MVLENGILKVTLLPSYGGRILSIIHKPSNRELLYQNPLGTPYLMLEGIVVAPAEANTITATVASSKAAAGSVFSAEFLQGDKSLLTAQKALQ